MHEGVAGRGDRVAESMFAHGFALSPQHQIEPLSLIILYALYLSYMYTYYDSVYQLKKNERKRENGRMFFRCCWY